MTRTVRRAGGFALVGSFALAGPWLGAAAFVPFALVAVLALVVVSEGPLFELFARPGDRRDETLYGLAGFSLAATGLALLPMFGLPIELFAAAVCLLAYGNLAERAVREYTTDDLHSVAGFVGGAFAAGVGAQLVASAAEIVTVSIPEATFLAACGALIAALLRAVLYERDDPVVMLTVGLLLWLFADLGVVTSLGELAIALAITVGLGYVSYALETASIPGMLTGVLLGLLTIVLGGYAWFAVLIAFFAIGGLATKFRYDRKKRLGVAEDNGGARGTGNVLGNSTVALLAVVGYAATPNPLPMASAPFLFAFAGAIATAMSDTLSSEIGGAYDDPRLITTLEPVEPGTDGGVTWQGELAGIVGAALVAGIVAALFDGIGLAGAAVVLVAGVVGMTADSVLGATVEDRWLGNQGVNFFATLAGALVGVGIALALGVVTM